jgi:hypothetical protein
MFRSVHFNAGMSHDFYCDSDGVGFIRFVAVLANKGNRRHRVAGIADEMTAGAGGVRVISIFAVEAFHWLALRRVDEFGSANHAVVLVGFFLIPFYIAPIISNHSWSFHRRLPVLNK